VLGLGRIVAITSPGNSDSIRILETLGLKFERMVNFSDDGRESRLFVFDNPRVPG
jgi:RimJ/RimL family protein N-acetyltransferase